MPKEIAPTTTDTPKISGVTTKAREARAAQEQPATAATLSIMPSLGDLAGELGVKEGRFQPKAAQAPGPEDEPADETPEETPDPEPEEESADTGTDPEETVDDPPAEDPAPEDEDETAATGDLETVKAAMQKRIDKLTAQRSEVQTRLEELEAENASLKAGATRPPATAEQPLAHVATDADLQQAVTEARTVKQWCLRNRNGGELPGQDGQPRTFDSDEVATMLANAEAQLDAAPARKEWLDHQRAAREYAQQIAPLFFQKGTAHQQTLAKVMATLPPAVKAWRPDIEVLMIQALVGSAVLSQKAPKPGAINASPQVSAQRAPSAPGGKIAPKAPTKQVAAQQQRKQLQTVGGGSEKDLAAVLESRLFK